MKIKRRERGNADLREKQKRAERIREAANSATRV